MYKVNLIKGWKKTGVYRSYRNWILIALSGIAVLLIITYLSLFMRFLYYQKQLTELANRQFLTANATGFTTNELTKTIYALRKLEQVREIYNQYPEFYLYHNFLLKKILRYPNITIDKYTLNREHSVEVAVQSSKLSTLFELIAVLENPQNSKYFALFEINTLRLSKSKQDTKEGYFMDFRLQFNELLLNEKN